MKAETTLPAGESALTLLDLLRKAAVYKGLKLDEGSSRARSEPIREYALNEGLLATLTDYGIRRQDRPDCENRIFTLIDHNPQENISGWRASNFWNFKLVEEGKSVFDLRITLSVDFVIDLMRRGVVFVPQAHGTFVSPADQLPNFRMFRALVKNDQDAPAVAKELAASNGTIVVTWTELGLGGLRRLVDLFFKEFAAGNETIAQLGRNGEIFNPAPSQHHQKPGDELFISEPAQPKIFEGWQVQLSEYRSRLLV